MRRSRRGAFNLGAGGAGKAALGGRMGIAAWLSAFSVHLFANAARPARRLNRTGMIAAAAFFGWLTGTFGGLAHSKR
jgi:hypothetical protein